MAITYTDNGGGAPNGSDLEFTYTFPVIQTEDVKVALNGVTQATTKYTVDNVSNPTKITFNNTSVDSSVQESSGAPKTNVRVRVYRETTVGKANGNEDPKAVFAAGSSIRATDLNANQEQALMAIHELQTRPIETEDIQNDAITLDKLADNSIVADNLNANAVTTPKINNGAVTREKIASDAINGTKIADDSIDSEHYVAGSIDLEHMSANSVDSDQYVDGSIDHVHLANDVIDGDNIQNDVINSEHYVALSIDTEHIANENVTTAKLENNAVVHSKLADNAVGSRNYADGSINHEHLGNYIIDGDNIQNDVINSEHYVAGSIDHEHLANDIIDGDNIQDSVINSEHYVDGSIDREHLAADIIDSTKLADNAVGTEHIQTNAVTANEIAGGTLDGRYFTETELLNGALDGRYFTETEADARYFNISTGDTIKDGDTFPDNDTTIATTAAINDRIIDLVDDVGGFVPIANETSFPNANPDVNNGAGTIVSVKTASTALPNGSTATLSGTTLTISNGRGTGNSVIITDVSATIPSGFGFLVETTNGAHTYKFHRLVPKATEVTTVAGISSNITTVANNTSNINAVAADATDIGTVAGAITNVNNVGGSISNVNTVAGDISNVNAVAGNATNINAVAGNNSNVTAVANNASNINSAVSNASNINSAVSNASNINTVAGSISNVNTTAGSIANVNTTASNIANVNNFAATYQIASSAPTTDGAGNALAAGDLYFDTSANELRVHNGSTFQGGVTATGNLAGTGANTFTGNQTISNTQPTIFLTDTNNNDDYSIQNQNGYFAVKDESDGQNRFVIHPDGTNVIGGNLDVGSGLDVTGNITVTGNVDGRDVAADGSKLDGIESNAINASNTAITNKLPLAGGQMSGNLTISNVAPKIFLTDSDTDSDFSIRNMHGVFGIHDQTNSADRLTVASNGTVNVAGNLDVGAGLDVTGNITATGNLDIAALADTTTNSLLKIAIQDTDGTLKSDDTVKINPAQNVLNVNGLNIGSTNIRTNNTEELVLTTGAGNGTTDIKVNPTQITLKGNVDVTSGIDVTGAITGTGDITLTKDKPKVQLVDSGDNPDWEIENDDGTFRITDTTNNSTKLRIDGTSMLVPINLDANGGIDVSGNITVTGTVDGRDVASDGSKLDGIEANATADQTASEILTAIKTVDGAGSGLAADVVDGLHASSFIRSDADDTVTGEVTFDHGAGAVRIGGGSDIRFANGDWTGNTSAGKIQLHSNYLYLSGGSNGIIFRENDVDRYSINPDGHFVPMSDSTYDIGTNGTRVRNGYFDTLYGDGSNLTGVTSTTINNNANNRVITGSGTANTLEGEADLTYDGTSFKNLISVSGSTPIIGEFRNTASTWGGGVRFKSNNSYGTLELVNNNETASATLYNSTGGWNWNSSLRLHGGLTPNANNTYDIGSSSLRWRNIYTNDLNLSNEGSSNDVDGTWGDWTIQEGESDLFLKNNRSGKKYKFNLTEVS